MTQLSLDFYANRPRPMILGEYEALVLHQLDGQPLPFRSDRRPDLCSAWSRMLDDLRAGVPHREAVGPFHAAVRVEEMHRA